MNGFRDPYIYTHQVADIKMLTILFPQLLSQHPSAQRLLVVVSRPCLDRYIPILGKLHRSYNPVVPHMRSVLPDMDKLAPPMAMRKFQ